jgi:hypothetical protein
VPKEKQIHLDFEFGPWSLEDKDTLLWFFIRGMLVGEIVKRFARLVSIQDANDQIHKILAGDVEVTDLTVHGYGMDSKSWTTREDLILRKMILLKRTPVDVSKILLRNPQSIRTHWNEIK